VASAPRRPDGYVLPYRTPKTVWTHITTLYEVASVAPKGMHSLRHSAGTRLYGETGDLEETVRYLGHTKLATTRIYGAARRDRRGAPEAAAPSPGRSPAASHAS